MPPKYITPVCSNAGQKANTFHMYIMTVIARPAAQLLSLNSQNVCAKKINPQSCLTVRISSQKRTISDRFFCNKEPYAESLRSRHPRRNCRILFSAFACARCLRLFPSAVRSFHLAQRCYAAFHSRQAEEKIRGASGAFSFENSMLKDTAHISISRGNGCCQPNEWRNS